MKCLHVESTYALPTWSSRNDTRHVFYKSASNDESGGNKLVINDYLQRPWKEIPFEQIVEKHLDFIDAGVH